MVLFSQKIEAIVGGMRVSQKNRRSESDSNNNQLKNAASEKEAEGQVAEKEGEIKADE